MIISSWLTGLLKQGPSISNNLLPVNNGMRRIGREHFELHPPGGRPGGADHRGVSMVTAAGRPGLADLAHQLMANILRMNRVCAQNMMHCLEF
jgi:hypothetical protein